MIIPFQVELILLALRKEILPFLLESVLQYYFINDFATEYASPSEKFLADTVEFFENHGTTTTIALHVRLRFINNVKYSAIFIPKSRFCYNIDKFQVRKRFGRGRACWFKWKFV